MTATPVAWSDEVDDVLRGDITAAVAYVTPAGGAVVTAVAPCGIDDRDAGAVGFTTSLGFGKKLERIVRDPHVALAYHARQHGFSTRPSFVLVQGVASVDLFAVRRSGSTRSRPQATRYLGELKRGPGVGPAAARVLRRAGVRRHRRRPGPGVARPARQPASPIGLRCSVAARAAAAAAAQERHRPPCRRGQGGSPDHRPAVPAAGLPRRRRLSRGRAGRAGRPRRARPAPGRCGGPAAARWSPGRAAGPRLPTAAGGVGAPGCSPDGSRWPTTATPSTPRTRPRASWRRRARTCCS